MVVEVRWPSSTAISLTQSANPTTENGEHKAGQARRNARENTLLKGYKSTWGSYEAQGRVIYLSPCVDELHDVGSLHRRAMSSGSSGCSGRGTMGSGRIGCYLGDVRVVVGAMLRELKAQIVAYLGRLVGA